MTAMIMESSSTSTRTNDNAYRRKISRSFKMRGLTIQTTALNGILNVLRRESNPHDRDEYLYSIIDQVKTRLMTDDSTSLFTNRNQLVVTEQLLADVVADMTRNGVDVAEEAVQLLGAFDMPRLGFDSMRKRFELVKVEKRGLFGSADSKVDMFAQRYALIQQRIMRQDLFRPKLVTADGRHAKSSSTPNNNTNPNTNNKTHVITPIESLLGRTGTKLLLGMIVQVEENRYYLEDHTAQVPMDLSNTQILTDCFLHENCIVLVEGEMNDAGILTVHRMGNPIIESRSSSQDAIGLQNSDLFGNMSSLAELEKLREQEMEHGQDGMFVVLSDVHLDSAEVMRGLDVLLGGFEDVEPLPLFVFMGNFCSRPTSSAIGAAASGGGGAKMMMGYFDELATLISKYERIAKEGRFVFVPGPNDVGLTNIMPRPPLPEYFTASLRAKVPHAVFTSNPCRLSYFSKEIVFCREDIVGELKRNCLLSPPQEEVVEGEGMDGDGDVTMTPETDEVNEEGGTNKHTQQVIKRTVKTLLDQGHLCPLPLSSCPIYWEYDHALRLYPLPDAVVIADRVEQYFENYAGCDAINPGPFHADFNFVVYRPVCEVSEDGQTKSDVEFSQIS